MVGDLTAKMVVQGHAELGDMYPAMNMPAADR
jgi:hypothetical protein